MLPCSANYWAFDQDSPANVIGNLEEGLPFRNESYDVVVALDVLEHTNHIHQSFAELCRVSRHYVIITLPNIYEIRARLKMLLGKPPSGKYGLPSDAPRDRHRWFFPFDEAIRFVHEQVKRSEFTLAHEGYLVGPKRGAAPVRFLAQTFPGLLVAWYVAVLLRQP